MDEFGILAYFRGVAVHDGLMSYQDFGRKRARCNAHHLRELAAAGEHQVLLFARDLTVPFAKPNATCA